jgi:Spy/CpxP family protein refolding chaperone
MRKSHVIALVVASLVSTASFAGAQAPAPAPQAGPHGMGRGMQGERGQRGLLRGITLSEAEKAKLKEIHAKYEPEAKALRESLKPAMLEARAARQKGDSAAARAAWDRSKDGRDKVKALMEREHGEIRAALSPENQKQFDANVQQLAQRRAEWEKGGKDGQHGEFRGRGRRPGQTG